MRHSYALAITLLACSSTSVNDAEPLFVDSPDSDSSTVADSGADVDIDSPVTETDAPVTDTDAGPPIADADTGVSCTYTEACPPVYAGQGWVTSLIDCTCACPSGKTCSISADGSWSYLCLDQDAETCPS